MSVWSGEGMKFLDIHFLDVGHGDCTIVEFPERLTVIDINNCKSFGKETESELRKRNEPPAVNPFLALMRPPAPPHPLGDFLAQMLEAQRKLQAEKDKLTDPIDYYKANFTGRPIFRDIQVTPTWTIWLVCIESGFKRGFQSSISGIRSIALRRTK